MIAVVQLDETLVDDVSDIHLSVVHTYGARCSAALCAREIGLVVASDTRCVKRYSRPRYK